MKSTVPPVPSTLVPSPRLPVPRAPVLVRDRVLVRVLVRARARARARVGVVRGGGPLHEPRRAHPAELYNR